VLVLASGLERVDQLADRERGQRVALVRPVEDDARDRRRAAVIQDAAVGGHAPLIPRTGAAGGGFLATLPRRVVRSATGMQRLALTAAAGWLVLASITPAHAGPNDLVLSRLGTVVGTGDNQHVVGDNQAYRSVMSELGVVMAPRLLSPADTLGFGGFQF